MFSIRFYASGYFAPKYFPKIGAEAVIPTIYRKVTNYGRIDTKPTGYGKDSTRPTGYGS